MAREPINQRKLLAPVLAFVSFASLALIALARRSARSKNDPSAHSPHAAPALGPANVGSASIGSALYCLIRNNSLSITLFCLFLANLVGESVFGLDSYNQHLVAHHSAPLTWFQYLRTGNFLDGMFSNWQAALLQLACLILFGAFLHQKGASHSRKPQHDSKQKRHKDGQRASWLYRNSLALAFGSLFVVSLTAHMVFGAMSENETRAFAGEAPVSLTNYLVSSSFWLTLTQTWEAEFIAIFFFIVLSIFLRQQGSAESKPVESRDSQTGGTNE
jgi:hypothetical protein